jgi:hypothetical protein
MDITATIWFALMIVAYLVWVVCMFRVLYRLKARADERRRQDKGGYVAGIGHTISTFGEFFTEEKWRRDRRRLFVLTAVLFAIIAMGSLLLGSDP